MSILDVLFGFVEAHSTLVISIILIITAVYSVYNSIFGGPKGPNPFSVNHVRPPQPLETDQAKRDAVLKQGFAQKKLPSEIDAIVIGSGIGGLSVANILSRVGKRVVVLEQHDQAGGSCHTFVDKGFEFDVGIHYIGAMTRQSLDKTVVDLLSEGQIQWQHLDDEQDVVILGKPLEGRRYPQMSNKEDWIKMMIKWFPEEEKAIRQYRTLIDEYDKLSIWGVIPKFFPRWLSSLLIRSRIIHLITPYFKMAERSLIDVVDELTENKELKAVFMYIFGVIGCLPKDMSFAMHSGAVHHYENGSSYPIGGSSEFAFNLIPAIEKAGGKVFVRAHVSKLLVRYGRVIGVRVSKSSGDVDIYAPMVISDAGVINTYQKMLPEMLVENTKLYKMIGPKLKSGVACMSLFVGLKGTKEELDLKAQNTWAFPSTDMQGDAEKYWNLAGNEVADVPSPMLFISFPSSKDPTYNDRYPGRSTLLSHTLVRWEWFSQWEDERVKKRGNDYEEFKEAIAQRMWQQITSIYPQLKDKIEYWDVGTPVSTNYYINAPHGEIYGLDHGISRIANPMVASELRPDTEIPGLWLTGQDVMSCGFVGGLMGGVLCASKILNRNLFDDLEKIRAEMKKDA